LSRPRRRIEEKRLSTAGDAFMKKWIIFFSMVFACCIIAAAFLISQQSNPVNGSADSTPAQVSFLDRVKQSLSAGREDLAAAVDGQVGKTAPTLAPIIPGTGRQVDHTLVTSLVIVAFVGITLVFLGLVLKK
jgi:hypothetical protein